MSRKGPQGGAEGEVDQIVRRRFFPVLDPGRVFVDVGAARPDYLSVSALFRSIGWRVLAIEPNPFFCDLHRERGYAVLQYACGDHDEDDVEFLLVNSHRADYSGGEVTYEAFSSLSIKEPYQSLLKDPEIETIRVQLRRLDTILETHAPGLERIDILSVDVEGWELEVMEGLRVEKYRPRIIILENLMNASEYRSYMKAAGYSLWRHIPPNEVYAMPELVGRFEGLLSRGVAQFADRAKKWLARD